MSSTFGRSYWLTYTLVGVTWTQTGQIYRPNANLEQTYTGTVKQIDMADGSRALVIPEITMVYDPMSIMWANISTTDPFLTYIQTCVANGTYLKIVDHLGNAMYGVFSDLKTTWQLDTIGDYYDVTANFMRTA